MVYKYALDDTRMPELLEMRIKKYYSAAKCILGHDNLLKKILK